MSQIFESLRRGRQREPRGHRADRTARADAVLATLGYTARPARRSLVVPLAAVLIVLAVAFSGFRLWQSWRGDVAPAQAAKNRPTRTAPSSSTRPPSAPAKPSAAETSAASVARAQLNAPQMVPELPSARLASSVPAASPLPPKPLDHSRPVRPAPPAAAAGAASRHAPRPAAEPDATPSASELFRLGVYYHRAGDLDRAQSHYRELLTRNELDPQVHNNLGLLFRDRGNLDQAVRELRRALIIDERYMTARNNLGVTLLAQSRLEEAAAEFKRVLAQDPRNVDASVNLALVEKAAGQTERAKESLLRALMLEPRNAPAHFNLATVYEQTGDNARAIDHYRVFLEHAGAEHAARASDARARIEVLSRNPHP